MNKTTPMMKQYLDVKAQFPDTLLLFRMGDFYEIFMEDAETAASVLEIALTSRDRNAENPIPMCGVPYHAAENYISRLISAGYKVAICDQVEDPKKAKGLVKREVTRVITPGLVMESQNLADKQPNYLAAVASRNGRHGLAFLDVSTGEFKAVEAESEEALLDELLRVRPRELLLPDGEEPPWRDRLFQWLEVTLTPLEIEHFDGRRARERLTRHFQVHSLESFGVDGMDTAVRAAGAILAYAHANRLESAGHVHRLLPYHRSDYMVLDEATVRNLDIFYSAAFQGRRGTLWSVLDRTVTAMGGRKLQHWLRYPLLDLGRIQMRQECVAELVEKPAEREDLRARLDSVLDVERLIGRVGVGSANARDLVALGKSLQALPGIGAMLGRLSSRRFRDLVSAWDDLADTAERIVRTLVDDPPLALGSGVTVREGVDPELDETLRLSRDAKGWMAEYEAQERKATGINNLKVRYNKVFGYFIEVSKSNLGAVPDRYIRKQTLVNAERFFTEELKEFETKVLEADEKRHELESRIFAELREYVSGEGLRVQSMADSVAETDALASLAELAARSDYCRPTLDHGQRIRIREGRHPVIESFLSAGDFVANDLDLDDRERQVLIVTGPNMAGKSTILRQAALIVLLAQIGGFVPAAEAHVGIVDRIFTRVGASDDLVRGRSTFMVEMQEAANILHQATSKSLVILDEIGRGTSTFDGMSIAWAVAEHLHNYQGKGVKTLFATHYHELTELARELPRVKNYSVAVKEWAKEIIFFHKMVEGASNRSYGIQVARLAGLPSSVLDRAEAILKLLEAGSHGLVPEARTTDQRPFQAPSKKRRKSGEKRAGLQLPVFEPSLEWLREQILSLDLDRLTPIKALQTLYVLQERLRNWDKRAGERDAYGGDPAASTPETETGSEDREDTST
jgi:DNA mismatch repair protein MutS